jgi:hypothetical protein
VRSEIVTREDVEASLAETIRSPRRTISVWIWEPVICVEAAVSLGVIEIAAQSGDEHDTCNNPGSFAFNRGGRSFFLGVNGTDLSIVVCNFFT